MRAARILGPAVVVLVAGGGTGSTADHASAHAVFGPLLRRTEALDSVTTDTSLDAYPADGIPRRGTADTIVDFTAHRASGSVEIQPDTNFQWWREGDGVFLQGFSVDISSETVTITDADPSWSPPKAARADTFGLLTLLRDARDVQRLPGDRYRFSLPMARGDRALRVAMQLNSPNLGDALAGIAGEYTRSSGTAYVARGRIVRVEYLFHGRRPRPSAAVTIGLSGLDRSSPESSPGPITARPTA